MYTNSCQAYLMDYCDVTYPGREGLIAPTNQLEESDKFYVFSMQVPSKS